ncbi:MAG: flagellar biosynthetic protein FliO [Clostridiales bacterium]|nr:flagellar biosynthetic protein FliO [Clostridiales bacterium]
MFFLTENYSVVKSTVQLLGMLVVFLLILVAAYYTTRIVGKNQSGFNGNRNLKVLETCRVSPNIVIQIIKAGDKYLLIGVSKERVTFLTELSEKELNHTESQPDMPAEFHSVLEKIISKKDKNG